MFKFLTSMLTRFLISILLTFLFIQTYSQISLTGNWRRLNHETNDQDTTHKQLKWGDLEIHSDSTFHIEGDSSTKNLKTSGWHFDDYKGRWELHDNNHLTLRLEPKENKIFLVYIIINLTNDELVLRPTFNRNDKKYDIRYLRLK
jgi:hypothetical protein